MDCKTDRLTTDLMRRDATPAECLDIARGFSRIFWGTFLTLVLVMTRATVEVLDSLSIPAYVIGAAVAGRGVMFLRRAGNLTPRWQALVHTTGSLVFLELYFAPFVAWWSEFPSQKFFFLNSFGFLLAATLTLGMVALLAAEVSRRLGDIVFRFESAISAAAVMGLLVGPIIGAGAISAREAYINQTEMGMEFYRLVCRAPRWLAYVMLAPCSLTLMVAWKARDLCRHRLVCAADEKAAGAGGEAEQCS